MRNLDFSSVQGLVTTLLGLVAVTIAMVSVRLVLMQTIQQRQQRENRQINERLRTLIAAYKTLGGSFTGDLAVDPTHLRDLLRNLTPTALPVGELPLELGASAKINGSFDRSRRIRDAVEGALSDVILLGTEEQVFLAAKAASDLAAGRPVLTDALVISLRSFIRKVLDLEPIPSALAIPKQGPSRPGSNGGSTGRGKKSSDDEERGGSKQGGEGDGGGIGLGIGGGVMRSAEGSDGI